MDACTADSAQATLHASWHMCLAKCPTTQQQPLWPGSGDTACLCGHSCLPRRATLCMASVAHLPSTCRRSVSTLAGSAGRHGAVQWRWLMVTARRLLKCSRPGGSLTGPLIELSPDEKVNLQLCISSNVSREVTSTSCAQHRPHSANPAVGGYITSREIFGIASEPQWPEQHYIV